MKEYIVSIDIAKKRDYFAMMIIKNTPRVEPGNDALNTAERIVHHHDIVYLQQAKNLLYQQMTQLVARAISHQAIKNNNDLVVDGTGVGEAAVDLMRQNHMYPIPIVFTGGTKVNEIRAKMGSVFGESAGRLAPAAILKEIHVPKQDLVSAGMLLMQQNRIHVSKGIDHRRAFEEQLAGFRGKVNEKTGRAKYEAETEDIHDDLVVCYLMAAWWIMHGLNTTGVEEKRLPRGKEASKQYEPSDYYAGFTGRN